MTEVLKPESPRWKEFYDRLGAIVKSPEDCHHDLYNAERVLRQMDDIDVEETIALCKSRGGCCDCEIMFNLGTDDDKELK